MTRPLAVLVSLAILPAVAGAQSYRVRIDARAQALSYRGLTADSVLASETVAGPNGGRATGDGFAVQCHSDVWCFFYRPGDVLRQVPVSAGANVVLWGLGVTGLTVHLNGRLTGDANARPDYPGTRPGGQLLEAYAEFVRSGWTVRGGRLLLTSRLEPVGFDGGWARYRLDRFGVDVSAYGGWGLGQAAAVPVTNPLLTPLDDFRPVKRQLVAGAEAGWRPGPLDLRAEYRREVDPELDYFVSERAAFSGSARPVRWLLATAGADYNLAEGHWGSADASLTWLAHRFSLTAGGRRYQPYFSLWTLWGAFSPVPYNALQTSGRVQALPWLSLRARGERYWYDNAGINTTFATLEDHGWRFGWGATLTPSPRWTVDGGYSAEYGPGSAARSFDGTVSFAPTERVTLSVYGGRLERPVELRYYDAKLSYGGARGDVRLNDAWRVWADAGYFDDQRDRPDAAASGWDQLRLRGGFTLTFGTDADRLPLPPARRAP